MRSVPRFKGHGDQAPRRAKPRPFRYDWRWQKLRRVVMQEHHGQCVRCGREASEVHHLVPVREAPELGYEVSNLEPLCRRCHDDQHGGGNRRR